MRGSQSPSITDEKPPYIGFGNYHAAMSDASMAGYMVLAIVFGAGIDLKHTRR